PVMNAASSEQRNRANPATSSGVAILPIGCDFSSVSNISRSFPGYYDEGSHPQMACGPVLAKCNYTECGMANNPSRPRKSSPLPHPCSLNKQSDQLVRWSPRPKPYSRSRLRCLLSYDQPRPACSCTCS